MLGLLPLDAAPLDALPPSTGTALTPITAPYTQLLAEIAFTAPSAMTVRVSEFYVPPIYTGDEFLPLVLAWGELAETVDGGPGSSELSLTNTKPIAGKARFSDLIRTPTNTSGTYELVGAQITLRRLGVGDAHPTILGVLVVEDAAEGDDRVVRLRLRDASLRLEHQAPLTVINRTDFPASPRDLAESVIPVPFGALTGVTALPIVAGSHGKLATAVNASATTLTVTAEDGSDLDATDFASLRILLEWEEITFTSRSGNTLSGCTRGAAGSAAAAHDVGVDVLEALTNYKLVVGEHAAGFPIGSITNVKADAPLASTPTVNLDDTSVLTGHHLATITIARTAIPGLTAVTPNAIPITVSQFGPTAFVNGNGDASFTRQIPVPTALAFCQSTRRSVSFFPTRNSTGGGNNAGSVHLTVSRGLVGTTGVVVYDFTWATGVIGAAPNYSEAISYEGAADELLTFAYSMVGTLDGGSLTVTFTVATQVGQYPERPGGSYTSALDAALGRVTADVTGITDDASFTGTAGTVLTNPADVLRYLLLKVYPGPSLPMGASWLATRAALATRGIAFTMLLGFDGPVALSDLRDTAGRQIGGYLYVENGKWECRVCDDGPVPIDLVLDYAREVWDGKAAIATRTSTSGVYASVVASYAYDYSSGTFKATSTATDSGATPPLTKQTIDFPWIQDKTAADHLVAYWLAVWKRARWEVELVAWQNILGLDLGDVIALDGHPILEAHGGAALPLTTTERSYLFADEHPGRIRLKATEAEPWPT